MQFSTRFGNMCVPLNTPLFSLFGVELTPELNFMHWNTQYVPELAPTSTVAETA